MCLRTSDWLTTWAMRPAAASGRGAKDTSARRRSVALAEGTDCGRVGGGSLRLCARRRSRTLRACASCAGLERSSARAPARGGERAARSGAGLSVAGRGESGRGGGRGGAERLQRASTMSPPSMALWCCPIERKPCATTCRAPSKVGPPTRRGRGEAGQSGQAGLGVEAFRSASGGEREGPLKCRLRDWSNR